MNSPHIPVLRDEVLASFSFKEEHGVMIDCTLGFGGHASAILEHSPNIRLIGIDQDMEALSFSKQFLDKFDSRVEMLHANFNNGILKALSSIKEGEKILGILADIGVSSYQLDEMSRGFAFGSSNLDMRMDTSLLLSAKEVLNTYSTSELEKIFKEYGEIREYKKLAHLVVEHRKNTPFQSAAELSHLCEQNFKRIGSIHPATLCFQAIRIEVNNELNVLKELLGHIFANHKMLSGAKIGIISFHSLEDRIIKDTFKLWSKSCICDDNVYKCECGNNHQIGKILTKKPIIATSDEIKHNKRARSAKLRIFEIKDL